MKFMYTVSEERDLVAWDSSTGDQTYVGRPDGRAVEDVVPLRSAEDCIVLLVHGRADLDSNLVRITPYGQVVWRASLPSSSDVYVDVRLEGDALVANTWDGYFVVLDTETGESTRKEFVK